MLKVSTHSGSFHADDVFAYSILRAATEGALELTRSRKDDVLAQADLLFDVGGIYDPAARRYDHHMRDKPLRDDGLPYSSAGLIWRDYGEAALRVLQPGLSAEATRTVWRMIDQGLIREIDMVDNGVGESRPGHLAVVLETWNPSYAEPDRDEDTAFAEAAVVASAALARVCARTAAAVTAMDTVADAARLAEDPRIIVLDQKVPWQDAVFDLDLRQALYVVRPGAADWTCNAVSPTKGSFAQRLSLPAAWGGLRGAELVAVCGIADASFCHPALFICGATSREGAIAMARLAVSQQG